LLNLLDKFKNQLEFTKQIQPSTVAIDIAKGVEGLRTFLAKSLARITPKEVEALAKNYTKLLQLVNDSAEKYCKEINEGPAKEANALKKQVEEHQQKLNDSAKRIEGLEDEIRKTRE
jgi:hypothetical protein